MTTVQVLFSLWRCLRIMKKINYRPKRTLRVVLYMNEENGQRGAAKIY